MVFGKIFSRGGGASFECIYQNCESACCKNNLVVLNADDMERLKLEDIDPSEVTSQLKLNDFLISKKASPMDQLEGLYVLKLQQDPDGNCVFLLSEGNCRIYESRPFFCREFPFKFAKGKIKKTVPCPGVGVGEQKSVEELRLILGLDQSGIKPPFIVGDENKVKMANKLLPMVFKFLR